MMVTTALGIGGGAEEQVMLLSLGLKARGNAVKIVSLLPLGRLWPELQDAGMEVVSLNMPRGVAHFPAIFKLAREIRAFRPDVVHSHMGHANLLTRAARIVRSVPVLINTMHLMTLEHQDGRSGKSMEVAHRFTDRLTDLTTVICTPAVEYYEQTKTVGRGRIKVVYNGVRTGRIQPNQELREKMRGELGLGNSFIWLAVGRMVLQKAYPVMFEAFKQLVAGEAPGEAPNVLLICGKGPLEEQLKAQVRELGIEHRVRFLGIRTDVPNLMNAADSFVMSSGVEGLPMVLLESSATGLPAVATTVGGNAEVVLDEKTGFLVPPGQPDALAKAMRRMASLPPAKRTAMGHLGREYVCRRFDMEPILDHWETLYSELIQAQAGEPGSLNRPVRRGV